MDAIAEARVALFRPTPALRVRWNVNNDTPLPPDEPMGENPAEGASINYYLNENATGPVTLEIVDTRGRVVRRYASTDSLPWRIPPESTTPLPLHWYRQPLVLPASAGMHRFYWDVRYQPLPLARRTGFGGDGSLPISASPYNTAPSPTVPFVAPGTYTVRLTVNGRPHAEPIVVRQDPRVKTPALAMREVYALTDSMYFTLQKLQDAVTQAGEMRAVFAISDTVKGHAISALLDAPASVPDTSQRGAPAAVPPNPAGPIAPVMPPAPPAPPAPGPNTLRGAATSLAAVLNTLQAADVPVTATQRASIGAALKSANDALGRWNAARLRMNR
jgi:hypothetical protein